MNITEEIAQAVKVHVVADSARPPEQPRPPRRRTARYRTLSVPGGSVAVVSGIEPLRHSLLVQASGNDVFLAASEADAQQAAAGFTDAAYTLASANTAPTAWESTEQVWAAAASGKDATLTVIIVSREAP